MWCVGTVCLPTVVIYGSFLELAKNRKFYDLLWNLQVDEMYLETVDWPLHHLCRFQPPLAVVKAVLTTLKEQQSSLPPALSRNAQQESPLHVALWHHGSTEVLEALLDGVRVADNQGQYPLHVACAVSNIEVIAKLAQAHPAIATTLNKQGQTPFQVAVAANRDNLDAIAQALRGKESDSLHGSFATIPTYVSSGTDDDLSSVGSRGVSKHARQSYRPDCPVELIDI